MDHATLTIVESITPSTNILWTATNATGISTADLEKMGWKITHKEGKDRITLTKPSDVELFLKAMRQNGIIAKVVTPEEWNVLRTYLMLAQKAAEAQAKAEKFRDNVMGPLIHTKGTHIEGHDPDALGMDIEGWQVAVIPQRGSENIIDGWEYFQQCVLSNICDQCGADKINTNKQCELCGAPKRWMKMKYTKSLKNVENPPTVHPGEFLPMKTCANPYCDELAPPDELSESTGYCQKCFYEYVTQKQKEDA